MPAIGISSVFGSPIARATIQPRDSPRKTILPLPVRAQIQKPSWLEKAVGSKYTDDIGFKKAVQTVEDIKKKYGDGLYTVGLIHNQTGNTITLAGQHDWEGHYHEPFYPPPKIEDQDWGVFLHVPGDGPVNGSVGAVVYRGQNLYADNFDGLLSWENPSHDGQQDTAYTEIREPDHYKEELWPVVRERLETSASQKEDIGFEVRSLVEIVEFDLLIKIGIFWATLLKWPHP